MTSGLESLPVSLIETVRRLRKLAAPAPSVRTAHEPARCELCAAAIGRQHDHLVEAASGRLKCVCRACALLFGSAAETPYRRVSTRLTPLIDFRMSDAQWAGLGIPIGLAFLVRHRHDGQLVAVYPSPGGAIESQPLAEAWEMLVDDNPVLRTFEPDIEALLVNRIDGARRYYLAAIDGCYQLVGLVRSRWRGFSGGAAMWAAVEEFLDSWEKQSQ